MAASIFSNKVNAGTIATSVTWKNYYDTKSHDIIKTIEISLSEVEDRGGWFKLLEEALETRKNIHLLNALFGSDLGDKDQAIVTAHLDEETRMMVFSLAKHYEYQDTMSSIISTNMP